MKNIVQVDIKYSFKKRGCGRIVGASLLLTSLLLLHACDKTKSAADFPPPGKMQVIAVEATASSNAPQNLIKNGNFSNWFAGATVPEGFFAPSDRKQSRIVQRLSRGGAGTYCVDQYWESSDAEDPYLSLFHTKAPEIRSGQILELYVHALSYDNTSVSITIVALDAAGSPCCSWPDIIDIEAGNTHYQEHARIISAPKDCTLIIASHTNKNTTYRGRVVWLEWRLSELPSSGSYDIIEPEPF